MPECTLHTLRPVNDVTEGSQNGLIFRSNRTKPYYAHQSKIPFVELGGGIWDLTWIVWYGDVVPNAPFNAPGFRNQKFDFLSKWLFATIFGWSCSSKLVKRPPIVKYGDDFGLLVDPWIGDDFVELVKLEITFVLTKILGFLTICFCTLFQKQHKMAAEVWKSPE